MPIGTLQNVTDSYLEFLQQQLPTCNTSTISIFLSGDPFVQQLAKSALQNANVQVLAHNDNHLADFSITFGADGEQLHLYDETGALVSEERLSILLSFLLLEYYGKDCSLVLPTNQPYVHEWLTRQYGASLTRAGIAPQDMMERLSHHAIRQYADAQLSMRYDAIYFVLYLAAWLQKSNTSLSKLLQSIPHPSIAEEDLYCATHLKGHVMRKLTEENAAGIYESADGIQIATEKGWIFILPDASRPVVHMTAEGCNEEFAKELLADFQQKINGYLQ